MRKLLRRAETELKHRYNELFEATSRSRDYPPKACLDELRRQEVMFSAPFKPGDRILVERPLDRMPQTFRPYLVLDVQPEKRGGYRYEVALLVKSGRMHKRDYGHWVSVQPSTIVRAWTGDVCEEGEAEARYCRQCAKTSHTLAFERGDLSMFEQRTSGYLSDISYRRKDRMLP